MRGRLFAFSLFLLAGASVSAQERIQRERTFGEPVFIETHLLSSGGDSVRVEIFSRLRKDLFVFSRMLETPSPDFAAHGTISVEIMDSAGTSVARNIRELTMSSKDNTVQYLRTQHAQIISSFSLLPGRYTVITQIEDIDSKRIHPDIRNPLTIKKFQKMYQSDLVPVKLLTTDGLIECYNLGGDVLFSQNFEMAASVQRTESVGPVRYSLSRFSTDDDDDEKESLVKDTLVETRTFSAKGISFRENGGTITLSPVPDEHTSVVLIPVNGVKLKQGRYELAITFPDSSKETVRFKSRWLEMPLSLTDLDDAILPLQYITTEDEYASLRKGGRNSQIEKFETFWSKKDPTPVTAYNEMMAEFYKRVDIAVSAYRTLKEYNGAMTDRGKIFILYGKPTMTDRILKPGDIPKEIWKYSSLNKTFVFEDASRQGNYKLTESK